MPIATKSNPIQVLRFLEILHAPILLAFVCPLLYVFYKEREESNILPLYLLGLTLLIAAAASRLAARRISTLWSYLGCCTLALLGTLLPVWFLGKSLFSTELFWILFAAVGLGALWMFAAASKIRMREKRRKKSEEENDISWEETSVMLEKPHMMFLGWIGAVYVTALLNACPILCNLALACGCVYFILVLIYREADAARKLFSETSQITHVPGQKIRRLRMGMLLLLLLLEGAISLPALLTVRYRPYRDLRFGEQKELPYGGTHWTDLFPEEPICSEDIQVWMNEFEVSEPRVTPGWVIFLGQALVYGMLLIALFILFRVIAGYFLEFRGIPEENGDTARSLEEDVSEKISPRRLTTRPLDLSWRARIRRNYCRTIKRYRKELPLDSETPFEIEEKTAFPEGFPVEELHESYEVARYGKA